jgi:hypothetical protein
MTATLERIAGELHALSLFRGAAAAVIPHDRPDLADLSKRKREILVELLTGGGCPPSRRSSSSAPTPCAIT